MANSLNPDQTAPQSDQGICVNAGCHSVCIFFSFGNFTYARTTLIKFEENYRNFFLFLRNYRDVSDDCNAGSYVKTDGNQVVCVECPKGQYQPERSQSKCLDCPAERETTENTGSTKLSQCVGKSNPSAFILINPSWGRGRGLAIQES